MNSEEKIRKTLVSRANCLACFITEKRCSMCDFEEGLIPTAIFFLSNVMDGNLSKKKISIDRSGKLKDYLFDRRRGRTIQRRLDTLVSDKRGKIFGLSTYKFII